ncbi:MAG: helix-turn-helix domain-containing protein [Lachnospiraceae bacterium]|nr:helix-turn-helix domain-containing protein [Lachnospiraceae bacterium]
MTEGERLYLQRQRRELTLRQAAGQMGLHESTLFRYEQDEFPCGSQEARARICACYQSDLWGPDVEPVPWSEAQLLAAYRGLDERGRLRVRYVLEEGLRRGCEHA